MHDSLGGDGEVFLFKSLVILNLYQVIWAELVTRNWLSLAVDKLDRGIVTMLSKE
jgi:hypothetical protein